MAGSPRTRLEQRRIHQEIQHPAKNVDGRALSVREIRATLALLFSRRWWWKTLILAAGDGRDGRARFLAAGCLEQRRRSISSAASPWPRLPWN